MRIWRFLKSKKLFLIIITLVALAFAGNMLQVMADPSRSSQKGDIYRYLWFKILVLSLLVNLTACTVNGIIGRIRSRSRDLGRWGSTLFHLGLIVLIAGTFITGSYRILGKTKIIEGQKKFIPYQEMTENFILSDRHYSGFFITFKDFHVKLDQEGKLQKVSSLAQLLEGDKIVAEQNLPSVHNLVYRDIKVDLMNVGYAALLTLAEPGGSIETQLNLPLESGTAEDGSPTFRLADYRAGSMPYLLSFDLYLDIGISQGGTYFNKSFVPSHPALSITVQDTNKELVAQKLLLPGENLNFNGYRLTFHETKPWTEFKLAFDPGVNFVFAGGALAVTGLSVLFFHRGLRHRSRKQNA